VCDVVQASGFNILVNDGAAAGQVVPHTHFHIIPRSTKDGLGYRWNAGRYEGDRMQELAGAMQETLHRHV
jgi:histidine triad (HIT) family protein